MNPTKIACSGYCCNDNQQLHRIVDKDFDFNWVKVGIDMGSKLQIVLVLAVHRHFITGQVHHLSFDAKKIQLKIVGVGVLPAISVVSDNTDDRSLDRLPEVPESGIGLSPAFGVISDITNDRSLDNHMIVSDVCPMVLQKPK